MAGTEIATTKPTGEMLLAKETLSLPKPERLKLLLSSSSLTPVKRRTATERQIKEIIDLYDFLTLCLYRMFPTKEAEYNCMGLEMAEGLFPDLTVCPELEEAFKMLGDFKVVENKLRQIKNLFYEYEKKYPEFYEEYNLEDYVLKRLTDLTEDARWLFEHNPALEQEIMKKWELI